MCEMLVVKGREALAVVNGLAHDKHCCKCQLVVVDNLREVFQYASINLLVWPRQVVAGCNGGVLRIFHQEFALLINLVLPATKLES